MDTSATAQTGQQDGNLTVYQTTGPDAYTSPVNAPDSSQPALNPRSCVTCRRRKVRCDKQMPCSNCRQKAIPCIFPSPGRTKRGLKDPNAPPRSSKHREAELTKRLYKLEGIVEDLKEQIEVDATGKGGVTTSTSPDLAGPSVTQDRGRMQSSGGQEATSSSMPGGRDGQFPTKGDQPNRRDIHKRFDRDNVGQGGSAKFISSAFWSRMTHEVC